MSNSKKGKKKISRPDPDPVYSELVDMCRKHGMRVGLKTTLYKSNGEVKSSITYLCVSSVLREEREDVTQVAIGPGGLPVAAKSALVFLRKKALLP